MAATAGYPYASVHTDDVDVEKGTAEAVYEGHSSLRQGFVR